MKVPLILTGRSLNFESITVHVTVPDDVGGRIRSLLLPFHCGEDGVRISFSCLSSLSRVLLSLYTTPTLLLPSVMHLPLSLDNLRGHQDSKRRLKCHLGEDGGVASVNGGT